MLAIVSVCSAVSAADRRQNPPVFVAEAELVVLRVTVKDRNGRFVTGLSREAFAVHEDSRPQLISFFDSLDVPVTVGLLVDSSGSMQRNRDLVVAAAAAFVETNNPQDETFALVFNEHVRSALPPDAPFTSNAETLRAALGQAISTRGRTALYDAIVAGLEMLARGEHERKVLLVVSDGGDNASQTTFDEVRTRSAISNVTIYTIGLTDPDPTATEANPKRLRELADLTGGEAFSLRDARQVSGVTRQIAGDIRVAYTIAYMPTNTAHTGSLRRVRVDVRAPDGRRVFARARTGYIAAPIGATRGRGGADGR